MRVLFVCSQNYMRSLTAETAFNGAGGHEVRSAGTLPSARRRVTGDDVRWAELIFVMETAHIRQVKQAFPEELAGKQLACLNIPDEFNYMAAELVARLRSAAAPYVVFPDVAT